MTLAEWLSLGQFVVMAAAGFFVWWTGRQNKQQTDSEAYVREYAHQAIALAEAKLLLAIERAERKAKHDAVEDVSAKILQLSHELDERLDQLERDIRAVFQKPRRP
jgi:hypothetical protein